MATALLNFDEKTIVPPSKTYCRDMLDPWVIESLPLNGDRARSIIRNKVKKSRRKYLRKFLKSAIWLARPLSSFRTTEYVKSEYERIWTAYEWPSVDAPLDRHNPTYAVWKDELLVLRKGGLNQMELDRICSAIEHVNPKPVLEIGCGVGRNLFALSAMYPDIRFAGYELSAAGVAIARSVQEEPELPDVIARFCPRNIVDLTAHTRIEFKQGDASDLPAADNSFDVVFTRLALEQMEVIKGDVLGEIRRIARLAAVLMEPFNDSNRTQLQRLSKRANNHFSLSVAELENYGLKPRAYFDNWPHKIKEGTGLVVASPA